MSRGLSLGSVECEGQVIGPATCGSADRRGGRAVFENRTSKGAWFECAYSAAANARGSKTVWIELIFPSSTRYHEQKKVVTLGVMKS